MSNVRVPPRRPIGQVVVKNVRGNGGAGNVVVRPAVQPGVYK